MTDFPQPAPSAAMTRGLSSVHHLRCRFRLAGQRASVHLSTADRQALVEQAAAACDRLVSDLFADDPGIYVLRRVRLEHIALLPEAGSGTTLVESLGKGLAAAVVRQVSRGGEELVHFPNQAEYVAQFIKDLLAGTAWERWYYRPFIRLRAASPVETLKRVLAENWSHLAGILAALQREGLLDRLLKSLGPKVVDDLWAGLDSPTSDREALRPLAAAALALVGQLGLWIDAQPVLGDLLDEMAGRHISVDWRDRRSLAAAVLSAIIALVRQGRRRLPSELRHVDLEFAVRSLDWLDHEWLLGQLEHMTLISEPPDNSNLLDLPIRSHPALTTRQSRLLDQLNQLLDDPDVLKILHHGAPTSAGNALRLYACLVERHPEWLGDPLAARMIDRLLTALEMLQSGDRAGMQAVVRPLGKQGEAMVRRMAGEEPDRAGGLAHLEWDAAGAALLLRTVLDARLPALVHRIVEGDSNLALRALLAGLLLRLSPEDPDEQLPPALILVCGGPPASLRELQNIIQTLPAHALAQVWLENLAGQRALEPSTLHIFHLPDSDGQDLLIGGDASGSLWPLGAVLPAGRDERRQPGILAGWLTVWESATGQRPLLVTADDWLYAGIQAEPGLLEQTRFLDGRDPAALQAHLDSRTRLAEAWQALSPSALGLPEHDLQLGLLAMSLLRLWARWLRNFSGSSVPYLLEKFVHRPGVVTAGPGELRVSLPAGPLDMILEMAGYFDPLERIPWLEGRRLVFSAR